MRLRLPATALLLASGALLAGETLAATVALLPVRRGVRGTEAAALVEQEVGRQLAAHATLIDGERTRDALRRLRLRSPENAPEESLREIAAGLGADWLVYAAVNDAPDSPVPDLTLSARLYEGRTGRVAWAGAVGRSGLDSRRLLGLGRIDTLGALASVATAQLLAPILPEKRSEIVPPLRQPAPRRGRLALVPFTAVAIEDGIAVATAATETIRAVLAQSGVELSQPGCVGAAMRGPAGLRWGELDAMVRESLQSDCGAPLLVTGAVERWEMGGSGVAPEPVVAVAVRLVDAASGDIVWAGSLESRGWDREGWFGHGRVYSRGSHLRRLLERISKKMLAADEAAPVMKESS